MRLVLSEKRSREEVNDYCSKIKMAGLGSFMEATTNLEAEITYMTPLPPMFPVMVPLPFVGDEEME